jgi:hypothetical protein
MQAKAALRLPINKLKGTAMRNDLYFFIKDVNDKNTANTKKPMGRCTISG